MHLYYFKIILNLNSIRNNDRLYLTFKVDAEKEYFFLEKAVIVKETEQKVKLISNEGNFV